MKTTTREKLTHYVNTLATLNGVSAEAVTSKFAVAPSVQQRLEKRIQDTSEFLKSINVIGVSEAEGETLMLGVSGPIASTQNTDTAERQPRDVSTLTANKYRCVQTNYDTHIKYQTMDAWAKFPDFQTKLRGSITKRIALDRIMIGFNGKSRADTSNPTIHKNLEDINIGWLEKIRTAAPQRVMSEQAATPGKITVGVGHEYVNLDALVYDVVNSKIEPWLRNDTNLVAIVGRELMADKYFPLVNQNHRPEDILAADMICSQSRIGHLPAVQVPFMPANAILITRLDNLSIYYQDGGMRRSVIDNPRRDRIETYQSSNDAYVVENYDGAALVENIVLA